MLGIWTSLGVLEIGTVLLWDIYGHSPVYTGCLIKSLSRCVLMLRIHCTTIVGYDLYLT